MNLFELLSMPAYTVERVNLPPRQEVKQVKNETHNHLHIHLDPSDIKSIEQVKRMLLTSNAATLHLGHDEVKLLEDR